MKKVLKSQSKEKYILKEVENKDLKKLEAGGICVFIVRCAGLKWYDFGPKIY